MDSSAQHPRTFAARALPLSESEPARGIVACCVVFVLLSTLAVIGRFTARRMKNARLHIDDWLILLALGMAYGQAVLGIWSVLEGGVGYHLDDLTPYNISQYFKTLSMTHFFFGISLGTTRVSICLFLMRVFGTKKFWFYASLVLAYQICWITMMILIGSLLCRPFRYNWDTSLDGKCGDKKAAYIWIAITDLVADTLLVALPLPIIWSLRTDLSKKIGLTFVFALGIIDMACGILRIIFVFYINFEADFTWMSTQGWLWSMIEPNLAIVVACSPILHPLAHVTYHNIKTSISSIHESLFSRGEASQSQSSSVMTNEREMGKDSWSLDQNKGHKPGDVSLIYAELNENDQHLLTAQRK